MCGEHLAVRSPLRMDSGSSPHVRGALQLPVDFRHIAGIIPACAGSTYMLRYGYFVQRDHPRMCGEHGLIANLEMTPSGSSPHVRGARGQGCPLSGIDGIIPACAGSTGGTTHHRQSTGDHPRMCGEHEPSGHGHTHLLGSSPHVRGARGRRCGSGVRLGIIPACAGSTDCAQMACRMSRDHPRMCGEHSRACIMTPKPQGSSPHVRGAQA